MHDACFICIGHIISAVVPGTDDTLCIRSDDLHTRARHLLHFIAIVKTLLHYPHKHTHIHARIQYKGLFFIHLWEYEFNVWAISHLQLAYTLSVCVLLSMQRKKKSSKTKWKVLSDNHPLIIKAALLCLTSCFGVRARWELIQPFSFLKVFFFLSHSFLLWKKRNT